MATIKSNTGTQTIGLEQTRVARYIALTETAGGGGDPDLEFQGFELPGLIESPSVIFFRTRHTGRPTFSITLNGATLLAYTFTDADPPERSWHHIIPATTLSGTPFLFPPNYPANNDLIFGVSVNGPAASNTVTFGDVVILYTSDELTVKIPIVIKP